ncbi:MAG: hypothetical protein DSM107014_04145 [Gomphosphaeria aponina SAG 52.96 = DSM 107014]|uniref:Uncharacterized protein n=1 Tax=Gomphosphaeria aponina SAG 52.96 = DSM 107014 TaxID=1521640 RepID=A0A941GNR5_9CHRO|nr:hypothetical protein [Gomphosphaeria aponina SAG 52.96 = DSM 107014]
MSGKERKSSSKAVEDDFRESAIEYVVDTTKKRQEKAKQKTFLLTVLAILGIIIVIPFFPKLIVATREKVAEFLPMGQKSHPENGKFFTKDGEQIQCETQPNGEGCKKPQSLREMLKTYQDSVRENKKKLKEAMDKS